MSLDPFLLQHPGSAGQRTITLDADTIKVLRAWKRFQNEALFKAGAVWTDSGLAFTKENGSGWHPGQVSDWFLRIARAAGLPPITLHGLRHGAASLALAAGTDVKIVSSELGYATTHFTQDIYQSVFPDVAKAAAEATAALLRGPAPVGPGSRTAEHTPNHTTPSTPGQCTGSPRLAWGFLMPGPGNLSDQRSPGRVTLQVARPASVAGSACWRECLPILLASAEPSSWLLIGFARLADLTGITDSEAAVPASVGR